MENAFSYGIEGTTRMQGGDSRYTRLTVTRSQMFRDTNPDLELEAKTNKVTEKMSESMNIIANEPSLAFFRIQEHVRKCLPQLAETKHEVQDLQQKVQGASFDAEYAVNAVKGMHKSTAHFQNIQDLMKNAMFMKQQIDYEQNRSLKPRSSSQAPSPSATGHQGVSNPQPSVNNPHPTNRSLKHPASRIRSKTLEYPASGNRILDHPSLVQEQSIEPSLDLTINPSIQ